MRRLGLGLTAGGRGLAEVATSSSPATPRQSTSATTGAEEAAATAVARGMAAGSAGKHTPEPARAAEAPPQGLEPSSPAGEQSWGLSAGRAAGPHGSGDGARGGARRGLQRESLESLLQAQRSVLLLNSHGAPGAVSHCVPASRLPVICIGVLP